MNVVVNPVATGLLTMVGNGKGITVRDYSWACTSTLVYMHVQARCTATTFRAGSTACKERRTYLVYRYPPSPVTQGKIMGLP